MVGFLIVAVGVIVAFAIYKLWKDNKAVTGASVVSTVESEVKTAVSDVKSDISKDKTKSS